MSRFGGIVSTRRHSMPIHSRRHFIRSVCAGTAAMWWTGRASADERSGRAAEYAELAHREIQRRFIDAQDVLLDFAGLDGTVELPTPEECRAGRPNALGWWTPIENGAMFGGMYLDGLIERYRRTQDVADAEAVRRIVRGLVRLSEVGEVRGFIARGFATDGRTSWPMGSNDQTGPWFYGLWKYLQTDLPSPDERSTIIERMRSVADVLAASEWRMPAAEPFRYRGSFAQFSWEGAARLLFLCQTMHQLTGEAAWAERYRTLRGASSPDGTTRLAICERGMVFESTHRHTWTGASSTIALRGLWELEEDEAIRAAYLRGLQATAELAAIGMAERSKFDPLTDEYFELDWRKMNPLWKPQATEAEAVELAQAELREFNRRSPRRRVELGVWREAAFAAWVTALCPHPAVVARHRAEIEATIGHAPADRLYCASFFPVESARERLSPYT
jgi:hypothetical protein